jgi:hypothetical protein
MEELGKPKQYIPIFVSSTFEDLKDYRTAVQQALHRMETIVRGMEYFGSKPGSPLDECMKAVNSCKVYIGIFSMRYGSLDEKSGKSMTQLEYEEAQRLGLPTLIYLIDEERQPIFPKYVDTGEKATKLEELKSELKKRFTISFFTTPEDLSRRISQDLPEVLSKIGIDVSKPETHEITPDPGSLISKFQVRPKKYADTEIILEGKVGDGIHGVLAEDANALNLIVGDAIRRTVEFPSISRKLPLIAEGKMADWLESAETGKAGTFKIRLLFGIYTRVDWTDEGPFASPDSETGFKLIELLD